jgi:hypothetical protein
MKTERKKGREEHENGTDSTDEEGSDHCGAHSVTARSGATAYGLEGGVRSVSGRGPVLRPLERSGISGSHEHPRVRGGLPQASQGASGGGPTSCNPSGSYGGLAGTPPGCEMGPDSTDIAGYGGSSTSNGDSGSMPIQGYITRYVPVAEQLASPSAPLMAGSQLAQLAASALSPHPTQPSDAQPSTIVPACSAAYTLSCLPPPQWPIL